MDPNLYIHTVSVSRLSSTVTNLVESRAPATVYASVTCLIESLTSRQLETIIGRLPKAKYRMTWGSEAIENGDTVTWNGKTFTVAETHDDTLRPDWPYQTCVLTSRPA